RHAQMPRCDRRPQRSCRHPAPQEREALESYHSRSHGPKRSPSRREISGAHPLATMERISPPKPHRNKDALCETAGQRLMARDFDRQAAELQVRIAVLNGYTALGIPVTEAVG